MFNWTAIEVRAWKSNCIQVIYVDVITYPHPDNDVDLAI